VEQKFPLYFLTIWDRFTILVILGTGPTSLGLVVRHCTECCLVWQLSCMFEDILFYVPLALLFIYVEYNNLNNLGHAFVGTC
jgi:hypothetical protein